MKLVCIAVLMMFFLSCCPKEADGKSFGAEVGIMTAKPDGLSCMFSISSNLPYDVGIYRTGHNVRLIEFPRIRSANGEVLRSYETGFPSWLDIAAKSSVSFQCDLPLSEKEQRLFFGHELIHAQDHCRGEKPDRNCKSSVCSELRAYTIGGCKGKVGADLSNCLYTRVVKAPPQLCAGPEEVFVLITKRYEECLRGYPH